MLSANDVASVIIARSGSSWTNAMSLQKILYYVQAWHLAVTDEPLFPEPIEAWRNGPVVRSVWRARRDVRTRQASEQTIAGIELDELSSNLIDLVLLAYGSISAQELSMLTHVEEPWQVARGFLPKEADGRKPLDQELMARFYRSQRTLGGRTAADLASGGLYVRDRSVAGPADVDDILATLGPEFYDGGTDEWGSANLDPGTQYDEEDIARDRGRIYSDA